MAKVKRGMQNVRTLGVLRGSGTHSAERHVRQFKIASLELERSRHARDREAAVSRIVMIDERLREIDAQLAAHYDSLGLTIVREGGAEGATPIRETQRPAAGEAEGPPEGSRRVIRY